MKELRLVVFLSAVLCCGAASAQEEGSRAKNGGVYIGADYFTGLGDTGLHDFLYLTPGVVVDQPLWHLDIRSSAVFAIPDGILALFSFLSGGDGQMPLWQALNDGDSNTGNLRMLEAEFRYTLKQVGVHKFDVGGMFDTWWMSPSVQGDHFGNVVWNVGPSAGWGYRGEAVSCNVSLQAGNGFSDYGTFNPFVGAEAFVRVQLAWYFGLYARVLTRLQNYDYSGFESNDPAYPPEVFDIRKTETTLSLDAGLLLEVF